MIPSDFPIRYRSLLQKRNAFWIAAHRARRRLNVAISCVALCILLTPITVLVTGWRWSDPVSLAALLAGVIVGMVGLRIRRPSTNAPIDIASSDTRYVEAMHRVAAEAAGYQHCHARLTAYLRAVVVLGAAGLFVGVCAH